MKTLLLLSGFLCWASTLLAQQDWLDKPVTVSCSERPLIEVLKAVEQQYGIPFAYFHDPTTLNQPVSVQAHEKPLRYVLDLLLASGPSHYRLIGGQVAIGPASFSGKCIISGRLVTGAVKSPVGYVNIGIIDKPVGTISNADGSFSLTVPDKYWQDTLVFSALGYQRKAFPIASLANRTVIIPLSEAINPLKEVVVTGKTRKKRSLTLGNRYGTGYGMFFDPQFSGYTVALLINTREKQPVFPIRPPLFAESARLKIRYNTLGEFKLRLRLLEVDPNTGRPGKDLIDKSIILTSQIEEGWLNVDLSSYRIQIPDEQFFLAFEWLYDTQTRLRLEQQAQAYMERFPRKVAADTLEVNGERIASTLLMDFQQGVGFGMGTFPLDQHPCYQRNNSLGQWNRTRYSLMAQIRVSDRPGIADGPNEVLGKKIKTAEDQ